MAYTVQQVSDAIKQNGNYKFVESLRNQTRAYRFQDRSTYVVGLGQVTMVDETDKFTEGSVWIIFKAENDDTLFRLTGFYDSYDGPEWDYGTVTEVEAREITTTVYETVSR